MGSILYDLDTVPTRANIASKSAFSQNITTTIMKYFALVTVCLAVKVELLEREVLCVTQNRA